MSQSFVRYTGDGETVKYTVPFPYIYREHVKVRVSNALVPVYWIDGSTVELPVVPTEDDDVLIYRDSDLWNRVVDYKDGSMLQSDDLNIDSRQTMFLLQEAVDQSLRDDIDWSEAKLSSIVSEEVDVKVTTGYIKDRLTDGLTESQLAQELRTPINKIDDHEQMIEDAEKDLDNAEARLDDAEIALDGLDDRVTQTESDITVLDDEIATRVTQTTFDGLEDRVTEAETTITQHADEIALKAEKSELDTVEDRVTNNEATLTIHADEIASKVEQTEFNTVEDRVTTAETEISQNADEIVLKAYQSEVDTIDEEVDELSAELSLMADEFTVKLDNNGHVVGIGLMLHEQWDEDKTYEKDSYVYHQEDVYRAKEENQGVEPGTDEDVWEILKDGARSEFLVVADRFAVINPDDSDDDKVPFVVGEVDGVSTVGVNGELVVDGSIYSNAIATDAITVGHIGDPEAILNINQLWDEVKGDNKPEDNADVTENTQVIADLQEKKLDAIIDGKTVIVGGYLNTEFIETDSIVAKHLVLSGADVSETEVDGASLFVGGKINTEFIKVVSDDGKTYLDGDTIYVEDEDGNVRVEMGKID